MQKSSSSVSLNVALWLLWSFQFVVAVAAVASLFANVAFADAEATVFAPNPVAVSGGPPLAQTGTP